MLKLLKFAKNHKVNVYIFFDKRDLNIVSRIALKFKMHCFPNEGRY